MMLKSGVYSVLLAETEEVVSVITAVFSYTFLVNDHATSFKVKIQFDHFRS